MKYHYPDLGSASENFCRVFSPYPTDCPWVSKDGGSVTKCRLFSQAISLRSFQNIYLAFPHAYSDANVADFQQTQVKILDHFKILRVHSSVALGIYVWNLVVKLIGITAYEYGYFTC